MYGMGETSPEERRFAHNLDPRLKICLLLCASILSVAIDGAGALLAFFGLVGLAAIFSGVGTSRLKMLAAMIVFVIWGNMFSQALFYYGEPRTVIFSIVRPDTPILGNLVGEVNVYLEGFRHGAVQSLRFSSMIVAGLLFCWTTDVGEMLSGLLALRVPYVLAFMTVTGIKFLPTIMDEVKAVNLAMKMRGGRIFHPNPFMTVSNCLKLARPVFINCNRRSGILSLSIQSRAFSPGIKRTVRQKGGLKPGEIFLMTVSLSTVLGLLTLKTLYWLYTNEVFYNSNLRAVYEFCRLYI